MKHMRSHYTRRGLRPGFTLVEVLVAVAILIIGVIAALRIFPAGFSAYDKTQEATTALKLVKQKINGFLENPDSLPDAILPVVIADTDPDFAFDDLTAVDFRNMPPAGSTAWEWYAKHLYPINTALCTVTDTANATVLINVDSSANVKSGMHILIDNPTTADVVADVDGNPVLPNQIKVTDPVNVEANAVISVISAQWPLWQPRSARVLRKIVGEKVQIPSGVSNVVLGKVASVTPNSVTFTFDPGQSIDNIKPGMTLLLPGDNGLVPVTVKGPVTEGSPVLFAETIDETKIKPNEPIQGSMGFVPKYLPNFGPIMRKGSIDLATKGFVVDSKGPVTIYDQRYTKTSTAPTAPFQYQLTRDADTNTIRLDNSSTTDRALRVTLYFTDDKRLVQWGPQTWTLPKDGGVVDLVPTPIELLDGCKANVSYNTATSTITISYMDGGTPDTTWHILDGSEQINRAFIYVPKGDATYNPFNLPSGFFALDESESGETNGILTGALYFSRADSGRKVKIDYVAADWNILHEDIAVGEEGYLALGLTGLKAQFKPRFPREAKTWGLYQPMANDAEAIVAAAVDLRTGVLYYIYAPPQQATSWVDGLAYTENIYALHDKVIYRCVQAHMASIVNRPPLATHWVPADFRIAAQGGSDPNAPTSVEIDAARGSIRLGKANNWSALRGTTFRVFYRAQKDWTVQTFRAPAVFWQKSGNPGWDGFTPSNAKRNDDNIITAINVAKVYAGHTIAVDYQYYPKVTTINSGTGNSYEVENASDLKDGNEYVFFVNGTTPFSSMVTIAGSTITLANTPPSDLAVDSPILSVSDIKRVSGELHTVSSAGSFYLAQYAAPTAPIHLRGQSVTVRAIWTQNRDGDAYTYKTGTAGTKRAINERWQAKSLTVTMPTAKE